MVSLHIAAAAPCTRAAPPPRVYRGVVYVYSQPVSWQWVPVSLGAGHTPPPALSVCLSVCLQPAHHYKSGPQHTMAGATRLATYEVYLSSQAVLSVPNPQPFSIATHNLPPANKSRGIRGPTFCWGRILARGSRTAVGSERMGVDHV